MLKVYPLLANNQDNGKQVIIDNTEQANQLHVDYVHTQYMQQILV